MDPEKIPSSKGYDAQVEVNSTRSDVYSLSTQDPALSAKMNLVNDVHTPSLAPGFPSIF